MLGKAQTVIVIIAIILMIACFSMLIWSFIQVKKAKPWPPVYQTCPDYWTENTDGTCNGVTANMGKCSASGYQNVNFGDLESNLCNIYNWTQGTTSINSKLGCTGVRWDGISYGYGVNNPCWVKPVDPTD
jgi:hypothetical protein